MQRSHWRKHKRQFTVIGLLLALITVALQFLNAPCIVKPSASSADGFAISEALFLHDKLARHPAFADSSTPIYRIENTSWSSVPNLTIDILSIGSLSRPDLLQAQRETMGRYVRSFTGVTEADDHSEPQCSISRHDAKAIAEHCQFNRHHVPKLSPKDREPFSELYFWRRMYADWNTFLSKRDNPGGWLCAQKRANDGLQIVLQQMMQTTLPDYLLLVDDDTFVDMPQLTHYLQTIHLNSSEPLVMAGCLMRSLTSFTIPFGGFGTVLSKGSLMRLLTPISCANVSSLAPSDDDFIQNACYRLEQNPYGERQYFEERMALKDLMHAYVSTHRFADHASWTEESSFCVHSDWVWGYFFNYYNVGNAMDDPKYPQAHNRFTSYRLSETHSVKGPLNVQHRLGVEGECRYKTSCPPNAHFCHYVTAEQIRQEGQRVFDEPKWVAQVSQQQPIAVYVYPCWDMASGDGLTHFLYEGIQASSQLVLTQDHFAAPVWIVDVRRAGLTSGSYCHRFVNLVKSARDRKRIVIFVYWDDEPIDHFYDCYRATRLLDSTTIFRYKKSMVQGRQWNETMQFVDPGSAMKYGNWREHSGGPVRHIGGGVRSETVAGLKSILQGASIWEVERPVDVSHFWPVPGDSGRSKMFPLKQSLIRVTRQRLPRIFFSFWTSHVRNDRLRDAVSRVIHEKLSPTHEVFVGLAGHFQPAARYSAQSDYLRKLAESKIVVVSQKDNLEDQNSLMEALVSGAMVMTDPMLTLPNELEHNVSVVVYHSLDDLVTKVQYYLEHEDERVAIAKTGYDIAMNQYRSWQLVERMVFEVRDVLFK
ncbi:hypothetical protein FisN_19Hh041 [Fistulifera solaris]|uniref:Spore protein YkvP/CgeB glycosyl transferase-like domain-containing protein n=1 Tax=Fistulifera solaris TaxID=1519565 RepID=A0A1Z5JZP4_FISSO|nr:hypothetical protein FisN_19Hh041 [Fistulifera solaris]|eukprot:GAX19467.1 hypothetical protein FisN_19Hh041 [Fistulifera solaris]